MLLILLAILGLGPLHDLGYQGQGVKVAIIDAGFFRANDSTVFDQTHIIETWDLIPDSLRSDEMFSDAHDTHGTSCLSTMLYRSEQFTGTAPDADYYLIRTEEINRESYDEVERLMRAFDMADSLDVDVITVSLGYYTFDDSVHNFTHDSLDGMSMVSRKVTEIAGHNRLVCIAAANEAQKPWHKIALPSDAFDILAVGAVGADSIAASFSSFGPSADGRQKPEVSALGRATTIYLPNYQDSTGVYVGRVGTGNGTSFATPEIAGMCACLRQAVPNHSAAAIREAIIQAAHLYTTPDDQRGYGIPDAWQAYQSLIAMGVNDNDNENENKKILRNGQILIRRGGEDFTLIGNRVH